ncbi:wax ester synthase/diacylglycerol acyltransferase 4-like [Elaeis guineensis]|uniref:O-acyltransferase WSD1-like n=1 Tax=Elaeis guineensis var. tenera TaxID=51953 RepID=A0A6I9S1V4_ELAGV|nr:O-acyltransferase WSD1-like [Elaeis guineensis]
MAVEGGQVAENQPVSPMGQYFSSSALSVNILAIFESEIPIDDSQAMWTLENLFLPINPRFSSIMVKNEHGILTWRKVKINLEEHVNIPVFPPGLEFYDDYVQEYLSKIGTELLPHDRPLWGIHIINYPTRDAPGTMVFKLHHALGDGFSLMGALFSCLQRADDPSLPLNFPSSGESSRQFAKWIRIDKSIYRFLHMCFNTFWDFGRSFLMSNCMEDDRTPIRSGDSGIEIRPITLSTATFSLHDIKQIKAKLKATVNDVVTGIIFYGIQLYMQAASQGNIKTSRVTALVTLNTRAIKSYQSIQEMTKPNSKSRWGNHFAFLHVSIPKCKDAENADPLEFVHKAKRIIRSKRNSLAIYLTSGLLELLRKLKGPEAAARYIHATSKNTTLVISNMIGPMEQVQIAGHPIKSLYFMMVHVPQSLTVTIISYMGKVKMAVGMEKGFINSEVFVSCMEKSFQRIYKAAVGKKTSTWEFNA